MIHISPCSKVLMDLILCFKKSTSSLAPCLNDKSLEFAAQMLIEEKAKIISGNLPIFPSISPFLLAQNEAKAFEADPELRATVANGIFLINKKTLDKLRDSEKNSAALGELYACLHLLNPQIQSVLQVFANNQEESLKFLKDELSQDKLKTLSTIFEVFSKLAFQEYATCPQIIVTVNKYENGPMLVVLQPGDIKLCGIASKFFSRLAEEQVAK